MSAASKSKKVKTRSNSKISRESREFFAGVERALRQAAKDARRIARIHGTPIYIWKKGKILAIKP